MVLAQAVTITTETLKFVGAVIAVLSTIGGICYFFVKLYLEYKQVVKVVASQNDNIKSQNENIKLSEELFTTIQKKNEEKHAEIMQQLQSAKQAEENQRRILAQKIENQRLRDKEDSGRQTHRIFETLSSLTSQLGQLNTSNTHILKGIDTIRDDRKQQEQTNIKLFEMIADNKKNGFKE